MFWRRLALGFCLVMVAPATSQAQEETVRETGAASTGSMHQGFWIGFGMGAGSLGFAGDASGIDRETGLSGNFRVGGTLSPQFLLGVESNGWYKEINGTTVAVGVFSVVAYFYPSTASGFFLKAGLGALSYSEDAFDGSGGSVQAGLGYDIPIGRHSALNFFGNFIASSVSEQGFSYNPNFAQVGLGIAWY